MNETIKHPGAVALGKLGGAAGRGHVAKTRKRKPAVARPELNSDRVRKAVATAVFYTR